MAKEFKVKDKYMVFDFPRERLEYNTYDNIGEAIKEAKRRVNGAIKLLSVLVVHVEGAVVVEEPPVLFKSHVDVEDS